MNRDEFIAEYRSLRFRNDFPEVHAANCVSLGDDWLLEYPYMSLRLFWVEDQHMHFELWLPYTRSVYLEEVHSFKQITGLAISQFPNAVREWHQELGTRASEDESGIFDENEEHLDFLKGEMLEWFLEFNNSTADVPESFWRNWLLTSPPLSDSENWKVESDFAGFGTRRPEKLKANKKKKKKKNRDPIAWDSEENYFDSGEPIVIDESPVDI